MAITSLYVTNVGPFDEIEFEFDRQVNVFTGPNNSGKSSALWVLGDITVYPFLFPAKLLRQGHIAEFASHVSGASERDFQGQLPVAHSTHDDSSGFWNDERWQKHVDILEMIGYSKFIPALRRSTDFRSQGPRAQRREDDEDEAHSHLGDGEDVRLRPSTLRRFVRRRPREREDQNPELRRRLALISDNPSLVSDEAVIQKIIELDYRSYLRQEPASRKIIATIGEMTSEITEGFPIEFNGVGEDEHGFFPKFHTSFGPMPLNTLSQGTQSIIQWLTHLLVGYAEYYDFPENLEERSGILIIDEIDAHLHPSWQRRIIPTLLRHFPNLQIFCSTHSPLMLAGLKGGQIQLLQRDKDGKVTVSRNEVDIVGWTADEVMRNYDGRGRAYRPVHG